MNIENSREKIDSIDEKILKLFGERMKVSEEIAEYKKENGLPVRNAAREREVLEKVTETAGSGMKMYSKVLFRTIMDLSSSRQTSLLGKNSSFENDMKKSLDETPKIFPTEGVIACQGIEGAYSQQAADKLFPLGKIVYFKNFEGVFAAVQSGLCSYGILPIENSSYGTVNAVYDLMHNYNFGIVRSVKMKIDHELLAKSTTDIKKIKEVYSHSQAIGQCSRFLAAHPEIKVNICENTAIAAELVAKSDRNDIAAIASHSCEALYGLKKVNAKIQNSESNFTRFICIGKKKEIYPGANRISLMLTLPHTPGSLYSMISKFAALGINLTKIESRPIEGSDFEFCFFIDIEASLYSDDVIALLDELSGECEEFVFLGGYQEV